MIKNRPLEPVIEESILKIPIAAEVTSNNSCFDVVVETMDFIVSPCPSEFVKVTNEVLKDIEERKKGNAMNNMAFLKYSSANLVDIEESVE